MLRLALWYSRRVLGDFLTRVLFLNLPVWQSQGIPHRAIRPLAPAMLGAVLKKAGHASIFIDADALRWSLEDIRNCIKNGEITCSKEDFHELLIDKTVADNWWSLTDDERDIIADFTIRNWTLFRVLFVREGSSDCEGGTGDWKDAYCFENAMVRLCTIGKGEDYYTQASKCYWSTDKVEEHCYVEESFGLPVYYVISHRTPLGHALCAIQIKRDQTDFNSWRIFQYENPNVKPSDWQILCESCDVFAYLTIYEVTKVYFTHVESNLIMRWQVDANCKITPALITPTPTPTPVPCSVSVDKDYYVLGETVTISYSNAPSGSVLFIGPTVGTAGAHYWTV